ncbi:TPA: IS66 family insertion sequence element accessory protein TnpB [Enterobacter hormaechei]
MLRARRPTRVTISVSPGRRNSSTPCLELLQCLQHVVLVQSTGDGLCLLTRRLELGRFAWPSALDGKVFLTPAQLAKLMEGIDWRQPKRLLTSVPIL